MSQGKFEGLAALSFPELHERSVPEIAYWRTINKLMSSAQVPDFSFLMDCVNQLGNASYATYPPSSTSPSLERSAFSLTRK